VDIKSEILRSPLKLYEHVELPEVLLDHLQVGLYISTENPAFEPSYIDIKGFSNLMAKMLNCLIQTETVCVCGFIQTV
jgi:hypothetical protein